MEDAARQLRCSTSRISRIESGDIKTKPGDVMELLVAYEVGLDGEPSASLLALARDLRESGRRIGGRGGEVLTRGPALR